jgi:hypothetical protein
VDGKVISKWERKRETEWGEGRRMNKYIDPMDPIQQDAGQVTVQYITFRNKIQLQSISHAQATQQIKFALLKITQQFHSMFRDCYSHIKLYISIRH